METALRLPYGLAGSQGEAIQATRGKLFSFIRKRMDRVEDAEDILQDVYYQLLQNDPDEPIEQLTNWLYTVAHNKIRDWYRKKRPIYEAGLSDGERFYVEQEQATNVAPDSKTDSAILWNEAMQALAKLPEKQRDVFVMHELEGLSFNEIAEITGEPLNTLLSRKRYATLALRKELDEFRLT